MERTRSSCWDSWTQPMALSPSYCQDFLPAEFIWPLGKEKHAYHVSTPQTASDLSESPAQHPLVFKLGSTVRWQHGNKLKGKVKTRIIPLISPEKECVKYLRWLCWQGSLFKKDCLKIYSSINFTYLPHLNILETYTICSRQTIYGC